MVKKCRVPKCTYAYECKDQKLSLFLVPKNAEERQKWSDILQITLNEKAHVCEKHFCDSNIKSGFTSQTKHGVVVYTRQFERKRLKKGALPNKLDACSGENEVAEDKVKKEFMDIDCSTATSELLNLPSTSAIESKIFIDEETQTITSTTTDDKHKLLQLRKQVKSLKERIMRRNVKIRKMADIVMKISESDHSDKVLNTVLKIILKTENDN